MDVMETPVIALVREYVKEVRIPSGNEEEDLYLQGLIDDFQSSSSMFKRDIRRRLERDPQAFLRSACRILKANSEGPGAAYAMEQLWANPVLVESLVDPGLLPLPTAITFAKSWQKYDPLLDIKVLHKGFPSDDGAIREIDILRAKRALAIVNELPADRHILLPLVNLLSSSDERVRSKAAAIYGRTCHKAEWVHKRLQDTDPRVRANVVESLWGQDSDAVRAVLKEASRDRNHRVSVNALIGLHLSGAVDVTASLKKMGQSSDPMTRAAAAFAMGRILKDEFKPVLETLLKDSSPNVRGRALNALIRLRRKGSTANSEAAATAVDAEEAAPQLQEATQGADEGEPKPQEATPAAEPAAPVLQEAPAPAAEPAAPDVQAG